MQREKNKDLNPTQILLLGFLGLIILGSILLSTPFFQEKNAEITYMDALFTATSAITVTGLNVIDPGSTFNIYGEIVILLMIQIGGLGFMTFGIWIFILLGRKITLRHRIIMQENTGETHIGGIVKLAKNLIWITLGVELLGAILLTLTWKDEFGWGTGFYQGVFHSVSAFNNAGFSLFSNSLMDFVHSPFVNLIIIALIVIGGLGFVVILDLFDKKFSFSHLSLHTKITLSTNLFLILFGFVFFYILEFNNAGSIGEFSYLGKFNATFFQVITTRTAGFNTLDFASLTQASLFIVIIYMFVGASSGSTGGGVKVTTIAVIWNALKSVLKGTEDVNVYNRRISLDIVFRSMTIIILSISVVVIATLLLDITERGEPFLAILFEATSAFGTVGLSMGLTPELTPVGRVIIMITMFIGRLGPLTFGYALARKIDKRHYKYPEEKVLIG